MRKAVWWAIAGLLLVAAAAWRLLGPQGRVVSRLGPLPDLMSADVVTIPLAVGAFALLALASPAGRGRAVVGVAALVTALLWVTTEWPWDDPVVPGLKWGRHGVHVLDVLAIAPAAVGLAALWPWSRRTGSRRSGHLA